MSSPIRQESIRGTGVVLAGAVVGVLFGFAAAAGFVWARDTVFGVHEADAVLSTFFYGSILACVGLVVGSSVCSALVASSALLTSKADEADGPAAGTLV